MGKHRRFKSWNHPQLQIVMAADRMVMKKKRRSVTQVKPERQIHVYRLSVNQEPIYNCLEEREVLPTSSQKGESIGPAH